MYRQTLVLSLVLNTGLDSVSTSKQRCLHDIHDAPLGPAYCWVVDRMCPIGSQVWTPPDFCAPSPQLRRMQEMIAKMQAQMQKQGDGEGDSQQM